MREWEGVFVEEDEVPSGVKSDAGCNAGESGPCGLLFGGAGGVVEECARLRRGRGTEFQEVGGGESTREDELEGEKNEGGKGLVDGPTGFIETVER